MDSGVMGGKGKAAFTRFLISESSQVCVRERLREKERERVCVRERACVCERERARERWIERAASSSLRAVRSRV